MRSLRMRPAERGHAIARSAAMLAFALLAAGVVIVAAGCSPRAASPARPFKPSSTAAKVHHPPARPSARPLVATATAPSAATSTAAPKPVATKPRVPKARPKRKAKPSPPPSIPERMAHLVPGSTQMVVAVGTKLGSNKGTLYIFEKRGSRWVQVFSAAARFGNNGLTDGETRKQGSRTTPTGIWRMGSPLFGLHANPPSGTRMPYRAITQNSWWSGAPDATYNTWVETAKHVNGEHLADATIQYEFALSSGYNALPNERVIGRGSAIFLHVFDPPTYHHGFTAGCVAVSRADMIRVFRTLDPKRQPTFAIGTRANGSPTSIYAY